MHSLSLLLLSLLLYGQYSLLLSSLSAFLFSFSFIPARFTPRKKSFVKAPKECSNISRQGTIDNEPYLATINRSFYFISFLFFLFFFFFSFFYFVVYLFVCLFVICLFVCFDIFYILKIFQFFCPKGVFERDDGVRLLCFVQRLYFEQVLLCIS